MAQPHLAHVCHTVGVTFHQAAGQTRLHVGRSGCLGDKEGQAAILRTSSFLRHYDVNHMTLSCNCFVCTGGGSGQMLDSQASV